MSDIHHWHHCADADDVAEVAAHFLAKHIQTVLADRDSCHVALPGGTTPAACLKRLATMPLPWQRIHWYLGDERCLPVDHAERNDTLITDCLWSRIPAPPGNCHRVRAELGAIAAASDYAELLQQVGPLDIVLLGMGEDGHTASLFPGNPALEMIDPVVPVFNAPKPPSERVSMSIPTLQAAGMRMVLITGAGKHPALRQLRASMALPINQIGPLEAFIDRAADGG